MTDFFPLLEKDFKNSALAYADMMLFHPTTSREVKDRIKMAFVFIFHTTKEGNFRGQQDFAHDVDVIIEVEKGVAKANGRFGIGGKMEVFK